MTTTYVSSSELAHAFPIAVRPDACQALSTFPVSRILGRNFSVRVGDEIVTIPGRLHNDPALVRTDGLTDVQAEFIDCLMTRHGSGIVREQRLARIIGSSHAWVPPFVLQLMGEYVIEILHIIDQNLNNLDSVAYMQFLRVNPEFLASTEKRVISYWNCYYRTQERQEYVGFRLLDFFQALARKSD